jgi:hypothetical protein
MLKLTPKIRGDGNLDPTRSQCKRPTRRNLEKALEAVRRLPPDSQDEIALVMLTLSGNEGEPEEVAAAHLPAILEGLAQAKRREFAADAEIEAAFRRFER